MMTRGKVVKSTREKFEAKFVVDQASRCWNWTACKHTVGYGKMTLGGRTEFAHRLSYQLYVGPIGARLYVLHRCDNRLCVNPAHLFLGTHADNMRDMVAKGRAVRGVRHRNAKLSPERAAEIRRLYAQGEVSQAALAREFRISQSIVCQVINGIRWIDRANEVAP